MYHQTRSSSESQSVGRIDEALRAVVLHLPGTLAHYSYGQTRFTPTALWKESSSLLRLTTHKSEICALCSLEAFMPVKAACSYKAFSTSGSTERTPTENGRVLQLMSKEEHCAYFSCSKCWFGSEMEMKRSPLTCVPDWSFGLKPLSSPEYLIVLKLESNPALASEHYCAKANLCQAASKQFHPVSQVGQCLDGEHLSGENLQAAAEETSTAGLSLLPHSVIDSVEC
ncbi:hypothetical protein JOB18_041838 [Solea senegalensis]|uniref:Uncharacterized protein n=1 Tax=Solea senegalensis TaxID=28829 RepID=A0AAV6RGH4_SOLSE|nr:hypothetical protein JOB18_041838 [Solea senegalensis]